MRSRAQTAILGDCGANEHLFATIPTNFVLGAELRLSTVGSSWAARKGLRLTRHQLSARLVILRDVWPTEYSKKKREKKCMMSVGPQNKHCRGSRDDDIHGHLQLLAPSCLKYEYYTWGPKEFGISPAASTTLQLGISSSVPDALF